MSLILTTCPTTSDTVSTSQHASVKEWAAGAANGRALDGGSFRCNACGQIHQWERASAWLRAPTQSLFKA